MTETLHILSIGKPVSRIVLGTWAIGRAMREGSDDAEYIATIHHAIDRGINLIDTALVRWVGRSEEGGRWKGCARLVGCVKSA
ncbi:general stress protein [Pandoraea communis]|uniref:General stress protein n=1 Tax=Pandoraea communis TaxID=2508297 RepID=A0A5E4VKE9_9BURK|nr:aldo/keto reductase [Pandoraea communis]VVE12651.1 general stress protein [Pandoraea communis]